jgi:splicing factor 3A subunit 1
MNFIAYLELTICLCVLAIIDRTASFVARSANPPQFEEKIRENQRQDPKFSFLNSADPYHAYYRHRIDRINDGEEEDDKTTAGGAKDGQAGDAALDEPELVGEKVPKPPPEQQFVLERPHITPVDL